jgi:hypothetical protein
MAFFVLQSTFKKIGRKSRLVTLACLTFSYSPHYSLESINSLTIFPQGTSTMPHNPNHLLEALFRPTAVVVALPLEQSLIDQAVANACRRWPALIEMVQAAAELATGDGVYALPDASGAVALCKLAACWEHGVVRATATGFGCTCRRWPPKVRAGPGDGRYCPDILAYLLTVYLKRPLAALPFSAETLWQTTLDELRHEMLRATYDLWLAGTRVMVEASSPTLLVVAARDQMARAWLALRLHPVIVRTARAIAGYRIDVRYVVAGKE